MKQKLISFIKASFPFEQPLYSFAYGSSVFKQSQIDYKAKTPQTDIIIAVKDTSSFHKLNYQQNPSHYSSFASLMPFSVTNFFQNKGSEVYYHPFIPYEGMRVKYGVVSFQNMIHDLNNWSPFFLAGRMQKPILRLCADPKIINQLQESLKQNRKGAVALAVLQCILEQKYQIQAHRFFQKISQISYSGDIRMNYNVQNPNKAQNIVEGSFKEFSEIYSPLVSQFKSIQFNGTKILLKRGAAWEVKKELPKSLAQFDTISEIISEMRKKVKKVSTQAALSGGYSTPIRNSIVYMMEKRRKAKSEERY